MKKIFAYLAWAIFSLAFLVIIRNIVTLKFPQYSSVIMGAAFAIVIITFFLIRSMLSHRNEPEQKGKKD